MDQKREAIYIVHLICLSTCWARIIRKLLVLIQNYWGCSALAWSVDHNTVQWMTFFWLQLRLQRGNR
jgi:hypothetical protein